MSHQCKRQQHGGGSSGGDLDLQHVRMSYLVSYPVLPWFPGGQRHNSHDLSLAAKRNGRSQCRNEEVKNRGE